MGITIETIRTDINGKGGLKAFSSRIRKERAIGCPMKRMILKELQGLSNEEVHVAFYLGYNLKLNNHFSEKDIPTW